MRSWKWRLLWKGLWDIKKNFTPGTCPIWGHVFGSKKSKKSDPQSHFTPKHDFQKSSFCSNSQVDWGDWVSWYLGSEGLFERDFEISKKNLHPWHVPYGGMFLEVKNPKNRIPKVIFHPNRIFKNHQFVVMFLTLKTADKGKCPNAPNVWKIMSKWWFLKILFGSKTNLGFRFLKIFTSKNMPPYGTCAGCKNFPVYYTSCVAFLIIALLSQSLRHGLEQRVQEAGKDWSAD